MRRNTYIDKGHMHDDEDTNRNQWKKKTRLNGRGRMK